MLSIRVIGLLSHRSGVRISPGTSLKKASNFLAYKGLRLLVLQNNNILKILFHHFKQNEKAKGCDQF
ncbi:hypothetical protein CHH96_03800 [Bacillus licheniformis]|nr:hypothetical protein CHH96_03800 [Bacillus licheniformis]